MAYTAETHRPFWRQPFLHFVVLGCLIFAWHSFRGKAPSNDSLNIVITASQVDRMASLWTATNGSEPTQEDMQGLIRDHVKEEVYYREARRLGLDQNDIVIRRRLRQKMEFLAIDSVDTMVPDDDTLLTYYAKHEDRYQSSATFNIEQVFYSAKLGNQAKQDLIKLQAGIEPTGLGEKISLPRQVEKYDDAQIIRVYGTLFHSQIQSLQTNAWMGPIKSGYGLHLVRVVQVDPASQQGFSQVKDKVERDWRTAAKIEARDDSFAKLSAPYKINIRLPND